MTIFAQCPCCGSTVTADQFRNAPQQSVRGKVALALRKAGMTPKQIAEVLGWNYSTVRSMLTYQSNYAKVAP